MTTVVVAAHTRSTRQSKKTVKNAVEESRENYAQVFGGLRGGSLRVGLLRSDFLPFFCDRDRRERRDRSIVFARIGVHAADVEGRVSMQLVSKLGGGGTTPRRWRNYCVHVARVGGRRWRDENCELH